MTTRETKSIAEGGVKAENARIGFRNKTGLFRNT
jgi:hypothetical protein